MVAENEELVALDPQLLSFGLSRGNAPSIKLRITNISDSCVLFKVKTTQPTWYYVRPNQHVVEPKKTEEVTIVLIIEHCNRFVDMTEEERTEALDKHRFLVQSATITDQIYNKILNLPPNARADDFTKVWESVSKNDRKSQKLKVEYNLVDVVTDEPTDVQQHPSVSENVESVRSRISNLENSVDKHSHPVELPSSPDAIVAELQSLRKKYDAVVEYTVHLTAERDYQLSQLEEVRREYAREKSRRKSGNDGGGNIKQRNAEKSSGGVDKGEVQHGFTLLTLIIVAVISFIVARYTGGSSGNEL